MQKSDERYSERERSREREREEEKSFKGKIGDSEIQSKGSSKQTTLAKRHSSRDQKKAWHRVSHTRDSIFKWAE